jgi:hypothetical protein
VGGGASACRSTILLNKGESVGNVSVPVDDEASIYDDRWELENPKIPGFDYALIRRREATIERFALSAQPFADDLRRTGRVFGKVFGEFRLKLGGLAQVYDTHRARY